MLIPNKTQIMIIGKLEGGGYIVEGPSTLTSKKEVLKKIGDNDFYKKEIR
jgi:hypothetical protein